MKIYISIPISGHDLAKQREKAEEIADKLRKLGHVPVNPFDTPKPSGNLSEKEEYAYYPAPDYGWYESDDEQMKECLADTFTAGANHVYGLPLTSRLTAEEKEMVRRIYEADKHLCEEAKDLVFRWSEIYKGRYKLLEAIFGKDFFKEE